MKQLKLIMVALMVMATGLVAMAQDQSVTVKGIVLDDTAQPVIGAAVFEKGNNGNGAVTGLDGDFVISVPSDATLVISYIGYKNAGIIGSMIATLGICIPSFVIIYAISLFFDAFLSLTLVAYAFKGIQICVVYLILSAGFRMLKQMKKTAFNVIIISATVICMVVLSLFAVKFSTIFYILISGALGVVVFLLGKLGKEEKQ